MASVAPEARAGDREVDGFFRTLATAMALTIVLGFSAQFLMGRSTFTARPLVHVHGVAFMTWVAIFVAQAWFATRGSMALHRRLGWFAAGWVVVLVIMGCWLTVDIVQRGTTPFFFQPQHFLVANPLTVFAFASLTAAAIALRKQPGWHMRLHICALTAIIGPAFGRLLPMPFLIPYAFEIAVIAGLVFPLVGIVRDWRMKGRIHTAWLWGVVPVLILLPLTSLIAHSAAGDALYRAVTAGHPAAAIDGLAYPAPPPGFG